jgi:hypothetical protein
MTAENGLLERVDVTARRIAVDPEHVEEALPSLSARRLPTKRDLLLQGLLHLPRIASPDGTVSSSAAISELERLEALRREELRPYAALAVRPSRLPGVEELEVQSVAPEIMEPILAHFHYLRSFRPDSVGLAAVWGQRVVAVCTVSPLDLPNVAQRLGGIATDQLAVISRVFAFDWAPKNTISFLLSRVEKQLTDRRLLLTYVNPNMGFTGASYRAANWTRVGIETGTRYAYLAERYITDRQHTALSPTEKRQVEYSRMPLRPLEFYGRVLDRSLSKFLHAEPFVVERPGSSGT